MRDNQDAMHAEYANYDRWRDKARLSVVMIGRDEGRDLIQNVPHWAGEVYEWIYLDTGTTQDPDPRGIAQMLRGKVDSTRWKMDFARARNEALSMATGDWILSLDCDEVVPRHEMRRINQLLAGEDPEYGKPDPNRDAFLIEVEMRHDVRPIEAEMNVQMRLFPRHKWLQWEFYVHEQVRPSLLAHNVNNILPSKRRIVHLGYAPSRRPDGSPDMTRVKWKCQRNLVCLDREIEENEAAVARGEAPTRGLWIPYYHAAKCSHVTGVPDDALRYIEKAALHPEADLPHVAGCYHFWGQMLASPPHSDPDAAIEKWEEAAAKFPSDSLFPSEIGLMLARMGKPEEAYERLVKVADMDMIQGPHSSAQARTRAAVYDCLSKITDWWVQNGRSGHQIDREALARESRTWAIRARQFDGMRSTLEPVREEEAAAQEPQEAVS